MQRRTQPKLVGEQVLELALAAEASQARGAMFSPSPSSQTYDLSDSCTVAAAAVTAQTMMVDYCKEVDRADRDDAACVARGYWGCPSTTELTTLASGLTSTASATDVEAATGSGYRAIHDWSSMSNAAPCILHTQSISVFSFMC